MRTNHSNNMDVISTNESVCPEKYSKKYFQKVFGKKNRICEKTVESFIRILGYCSVLITIAFIVLLGKDALLFFLDEKVSLKEFFLSTEWQPAIGKIGVLPLVNATIITSIIALGTAAPISILTAIYLSEFAKKKVRSKLKPILEMLASIPSVVYGFFAVTFVTPLLKLIIGENVVQIYNNLSAGIVIGMLIIPLITSMIEDAIHSVPKSLRFAALALGATKVETTIKVVVPASISGIVAALIIGFSRAIGETMIVALAAGAGANFTFNPLKAAETITGYIVRISGGDVSFNTIDYNSIFALGLLLFFMTLVLNYISNIIVEKYSEIYE